MKKLISLLVSGLFCLLLSAVVHAQGVGSSGDIKGTVADANGASVPKATILALSTQTGLRRTVETDESGQYVIVGLSPATYDVSVEVGGFQTEVRKGVIVSIGQTALVDFQLKVSGVKTISATHCWFPAFLTQPGSPVIRTFELSKRRRADSPSTAATAAVTV